MSFTYYSALRPLGRGCYPDEAANPAVEVVNYHGQREVTDGRTAWGHVAYEAPLTQAEKEHFSFFEMADVDGTAKIDARAERIAKALERKGGIPSAEGYEVIRPMMADAPEVLEMSDREILSAMLEYFGVGAAA